MIVGNTAPRAAWTELAIMVLRVVVVGLVELVELIGGAGGVPVGGVLEEVVVILVQDRSAREILRIVG